MIFRAYASKNPGVWGGPQGALMAQRRNNRNRKFTIFAILLLPRIKTVADPTKSPRVLEAIASGKQSGFSLSAPSSVANRPEFAVT